MDSQKDPCPYCHEGHKGKCALVKAFEYHPDGTIKRVEFYAPNDYAPIMQSVYQPTPIPRQVHSDPGRKVIT